MSNEQEFYWPRERIMEVFRQAHALRSIADLAADRGVNHADVVQYRVAAEETENCGFGMLRMPAVPMTIGLVAHPVGDPVPEVVQHMVRSFGAMTLQVDDGGRAVTYSTHS